MGQQQFFRGDPFVQQRVTNSGQNISTPQLDHNLIVLEICNNWESVLDLFKRIEKGDVDLVNQLEGVWIQFLSACGVSINQFKDAEEFEKQLIKSLV